MLDFSSNIPPNFHKCQNEKKREPAYQSYFCTIFSLQKSSFLVEQVFFMFKVLRQCLPLLSFFIFKIVPTVMVHLLLVFDLAAQVLNVSL